MAHLKEQFKSLETVPEETYVSDLLDRCWKLEYIQKAEGKLK